MRTLQETRAARLTYHKMQVLCRIYEGLMDNKHKFASSDSLAHAKENSQGAVGKRDDRLG